MGLQLSDPLQTFISVFAQGMSPNLHRSLRHSQQAGRKVTLSTGTAALIPLWIHFNVLVSSLYFICRLVCVWLILHGWDSWNNSC